MEENYGEIEGQEQWTTEEKISVSENIVPQRELQVSSKPAVHHIMPKSPRKPHITPQSKPNPQGGSTLLPKVQPKKTLPFVPVVHPVPLKMDERRVYTGWSIRSLYIHMRIVGEEIVAPEQRVVSFGLNGSTVEAIIAQYTLTIPSESSLELRHMEFYPGTNEMIESYASAL